MILGESKPDKIPGHSWLSFFTGSAIILSLLYRTFSHRLRFFLSRHTFTHFSVEHFPLRFTHFFGAFCRDTFTQFCIEYFPTDLRTFLSNFVATEVYALLLNPSQESFFLAGSLFSFPCLSQNLSSPPELYLKLKSCTQSHSYNKVDHL